MVEDYSGSDAVEIAVQIEKNGEAFYAKLAERAPQGEVKELFQYLAEAEKEHVATFQQILKEVFEYKPQDAFPEVFFVYMHELASQYVFTQKGKGEEVASSVKDFSEGIGVALGFERDSINFFEEVKKMVPEKDKGLIDKVIQEEKKHIKQLLDKKEVGGV